MLTAVLLVTLSLNSITLHNYGSTNVWFSDLILDLVIEELETQIPSLIIRDVYDALCEMIQIAIKVEEKKEKKKRKW